jgi:hypothetical protein
VQLAWNFFNTTEESVLANQILKFRPEWFHFFYNTCVMYRFQDDAMLPSKSSNTFDSKYILKLTEHFKFSF